MTAFTTATSNVFTFLICLRLKEKKKKKSHGFYLTSRPLYMCSHLWCSKVTTTILKTRQEAGNYKAGGNDNCVKLPLAVYLHSESSVKLSDINGKFFDLDSTVLRRKIVEGNVVLLLLCNVSLSK